MTRLLDVPADVLVYILYAFDLSFADVVSVTGTCRALRAVGRREFLEQYRFLSLRMKLMSPDDRDALDLNSAAHIILRWRLMRIWPVLRLRDPKSKFLRGYVLALCQFGMFMGEDALGSDEVAERVANFADNRSMVLRVLGFNASNNPRTPGLERFAVTSRALYRSMIDRLVPEDVIYFLSVGWLFRCAYFRTRYPVHCAVFVPDDLDLERIEAQGHQDVLEHVLPHKCRGRDRLRKGNASWTRFASASARKAVYEEGDMALLETVTNIDLIRLMVTELNRLKLMPEYVEKYKHLVVPMRTYADIAKDGKASYLANEPVDFNLLLHALVRK